MGSAFAFNASITGGSSRVTPDITGSVGYHLLLIATWIVHQILVVYLL